MRFSILTATYNRAHTLHRVYESLCAQTFRDFEWLVVDDGSTDGTQALVARWKASFPVRYLWKPNGGKHTAINLGASLAMGELTLIFDSDDRCTPNTLERFDFHWQQLQDPGRFAVLCCNCQTPKGSLVGSPYSKEQIDAFTLAETLRCLGGVERWAAVRTDILRAFPYPEGERFVMEALVWYRIARRYAFRFFNEPLRILYLSPNSLSRRGMELLISSPKATLTYHRELFLSPVPLPVRLKAAANYCRFALLAAGRKLRHLRVKNGVPENLEKTHEK